MVAISLTLILSTGRGDASPPDKIVRGNLGADRQSVVLTLGDGTVLRRQDHGVFGFDGLRIDVDRRTASSNVLFDLGRGNFHYPVAIGVEVWRPAARLNRVVYCDDAVLSHWWFWSRGRDIVVDCGTAHGPPGEHHLLVDLGCGRPLVRVDHDDRSGAPIGSEPAWSVLRLGNGDGPDSR